MKRTNSETKDRVFMSHKGKRIWYSKTNEGDTIFMVARGDGTDEYFTDWQDAMHWIDERRQGCNA